MQCCARVLMFVLLTSTAGAAETPAALVVAEGRDGAAVRARVVKACGKAVRVVDDRSAAPALAAEGLKGDLLASGAPPSPTLEKLAAAGRRLGVTAVVLARTTQLAKRPALRLVVVAVASRAAVADQVVPLGRMVEQKKRKPEWRDDSSELEAALRTALETAQWAASQAAAPVAVAPTPAPPAAEPVAAPVTTVTESAPRRPGELAEAFIALREGDRSFGYRSDTGLPLRTYSPRVVGAPGFAFEVRVFPLVLFSPNPWLRDLGLEGGWERAVALTAKDTNTRASYSITSQSWRLLARLRFGGGSWQAAPAVGYEQLDFELAGGSSELPAAAYRMLRFGGDGSLDVGPVRVLARLAYLLPVSIGPALDRYFDPGWGVDASGGAAYPLLAGLEAVGLVRYTRLASSGATGGSAADTFYSLQLGMAYRL